MASRSGTLYVGATNDLMRRVYEHQHGLVKGFTSRYRVTRLVYFEDTDRVGAAIEREKELKGWLRAKKIALVETTNPEWHDLSKGWFGKSGAQDAPGIAGKQKSRQEDRREILHCADSVQDDRAKTTQFRMTEEKGTPLRVTKKRRSGESKAK